MDEDEPGPSSRAPSRASNASSRPSSRLSSYGNSSVASESDEDVVPRKKAKAKRARPAVSNTESFKSGGESNSHLFLTAAEKRAQQQKTDKKSAEDPFSFLVNVKDKDGNRPGEPGYDPRTLYVPEKAWKEFTPFERQVRMLYNVARERCPADDAQFWEIKQNHYDTILFFQKGKFFELYEEDARIGHQEFDLKLTQRVKMSMVS